MIIMPGVDSPSTLDFVELVRTNSERWIDITFQDDTGTPIDLVEELTSSGEPKGELDLEVTTLGGTVLYSETYWPIPIPDTRRIQHPSTGKYYIKWGDSEYTVPGTNTSAGETATAGTQLFNWHIRRTEGEEDFYKTQLVEVISPRVLAMLPRLRLMMDKSLKVILPEQFCVLGFSDSQLIVYLQMALSRINSAQPYVSWSSIDAFPLEGYFEILIRTAMLSALDSQAIFAIDTDTDTFSDSGHSFVISHFTKLKAMRDSLAAELDKDIREFKLHFVGSGSLGAEFRLGLTYYSMLTSAPPGSLFRNTIAYMP
jgi:hypothetical protein